MRITTGLLAWAIIGWGAMEVASRAEADAGGDRRRVLMVGNSYTAGIKDVLEKFFAASRHSGLEFDFVDPGGRTLERHLGDGKTLEKIRGGRWDIVVLQEQSQTPAYPGLREKFLKASAGLGAVVEEAGAETWFYETWGRRDGDRSGGGLAPDFASMQELLSEGYGEAGRRTGGKVVPVGRAWAEVWKRDPELAKTLYQRDGSHPSASGAYLVACVFYLALTGGDPGEVGFEAGLSEGVAEKLRAAAKEVTGGAGRQGGGR